MTTLARIKLIEARTLSNGARLFRYTIDGVKCSSFARRGESFFDYCKRLGYQSERYASLARYIKRGSYWEVVKPLHGKRVGQLIRDLAGAEAMRAYYVEHASVTVGSLTFHRNAVGRTWVERSARHNAPDEVAGFKRVHFTKQLRTSAHEPTRAHAA